jgi:hypothetical protein
MGNLLTAYHGVAADAETPLASTVDPTTSLSGFGFAMYVVVCCVEAFLAIGHGRILCDGLRSTLPWGTCLLPTRKRPWRVLLTGLRLYIALRLLCGW